jgi:hypothetical protein
MGATERKFDELVAAARLDPSVVQPKIERRIFLFESTAIFWKVTLPKNKR